MTCGGSDGNRHRSPLRAVDLDRAEQRRVERQAGAAVVAELQQFDVVGGSRRRLACLATPAAPQVSASRNATLTVRPLNSSGRGAIDTAPAAIGELAGLLAPCRVVRSRVVQSIDELRLGAAPGRAAARAAGRRCAAARAAVRRAAAASISRAERDVVVARQRTTEGRAAAAATSAVMRTHRRFQSGRRAQAIGVWRAA